MAFCPNCGASVEGRFCARCGAAVNSPGEGPTPASSPEGQGYQSPSGSQSYAPPGAQPYSQSSGKGLTDNTAGALCYVLGLITGILFLVLDPYNRSKFVRFHAFQAIFFHVGWIALWIVLSIVLSVLPSVLGILTGLLTMFLALAGLIVWVMLIIKAYNGQMFKLPVVGDMAEKQA